MTVVEQNISIERPYRLINEGEEQLPALLAQVTYIVKYLSKRNLCFLGGKPRKFSANSPLNHPPTKISKLKNSSASPAPSQHTDDSSDVSSHNPKQIYHRNDTPNKFWLSIEPFTVPITQEDIRLLDVLLEEYSGVLAPQIPDLGPHFAAQWGVDDVVVKEEVHQDANSPTLGKRESVGSKKNPVVVQNGTSVVQQNGDVMRVLRNSKKMGMF